MDECGYTEEEVKTFIRQFGTGHLGHHVHAADGPPPILISCDDCRVVRGQPWRSEPRGQVIPFRGKEDGISLQ